jgi:uncharacterized protein YuzE
MKKTKPYFSYDPEADGVMFSVTEDVNIDYATEFGNIIVSFSSEGNPVLIEILEASKFFKKHQESFSQMGVVFA